MKFTPLSSGFGFETSDADLSRALSDVDFART